MEVSWRGKRNSSVETWRWSIFGASRRDLSIADAIRMQDARKCGKFENKKPVVVEFNFISDY
jgi:hypothetical protein